MSRDLEREDCTKKRRGESKREIKENKSLTAELCLCLVGWLCFFFFFLIRKKKGREPLRIRKFLMGLDIKRNLYRRLKDKHILKDKFRKVA